MDESRLGLTCNGKVGRDVEDRLIEIIDHTGHTFVNCLTSFCLPGSGGFQIFPTSQETVP